MQTAVRQIENQSSPPGRVPRTETPFAGHAPVLIYGKLGATMFFWGGTFVAGRLLAGEVPPLSAAFVRFAIATALLLVLLRRVEGRFPRLGSRQLGAVVLLGLTGVLGYNVCFFSGLQAVPAGRAALIIALNPVGIAVLSALFCGESMHPGKVLGVLLSVSGALFVITDGQLVNLLTAGIGRGELYLFGCVLCWSLYTIIGQRVMRGLSPLAAVSYSALAGTLLLLPLAGTEGVFEALLSYSGRSWASLAYLGLCGTGRGLHLVLPRHPHSGGGPGGGVHQLRAGLRRSAVLPPARRTPYPVPTSGCCDGRRRRLDDERKGIGADEGTWLIQRGDRIWDC